MKPSHLQKISPESIFIWSTRECEDNIEETWSRECRFLFPDSASLEQHHCCYFNVPFRIQSGPSCGLVCLRCSFDYFVHNSTHLSSEEKSRLQETVTADQLLKRGQEAGFTSKGEMFSAHDMVTLANSTYGAYLRAEEHQSIDMPQMLSHLAQGHPILFPYDNAPNNLPAKKKGKSAHWAVIVGFFVPLSCIIDEKLVKNTPPSPRTSLDNSTSSQAKLPSSLTFAPKPSSCSSCRRDFADIKEEDVILLYQQPKSRRRYLAKFQDMVASNLNLEDPHIAPENTDFVLKNERLEGLRSKLVYLFPKLNK